MVRELESRSARAHGEGILSIASAPFLARPSRIPPSSRWFFESGAWLLLGSSPAGFPWEGPGDTIRELGSRTTRRRPRE